jgi:hypothetical protein
MSTNKTTYNLLRHYSQSVYEMIDAFMRSMPIFHPPHVHDLMQKGDGIYVPPPRHLHNKLIKSSATKQMPPLVLGSP